jgi:hypothetical protein
LTVKVAELPGAIGAVLTTPDGVWTASAWVIVPVFFIVIVTVPVFATDSEAGVILNSVSLRASPLPPPLADEPDEPDELLLLLDDPHPATATAAATETNATIRFMPIKTPRTAETFPAVATLETLS